MRAFDALIIVICKNGENIDDLDRIAGSVSHATRFVQICVEDKVLILLFFGNEIRSPFGLLLPANKYILQFERHLAIFPS